MVAADAAIFADTQAEPRAVYRHLWSVLAPRCAAVGFPLHVVSAGDLAEDIAGRTTTRIPAFVDTGMMPRQCTRDYKLRPIRRELRRMVGRRGSAVQLLGISLDEVQRMRTSPVGWLATEYPLVDRRMTRWDCERFLAARGIEAPKSACVFCPFHSDAQWRDLSPEDFTAAAAFEERMQGAMRGHQKTLRGVPYLHRSLRPLRLVDLSTAEDHGQLNWLGECQGVCGV